MSRKLETWIREIKKRHGKTKLWKRILSFMMAITVFTTTYALILPAITMDNTYCGIEEHTHSVEDGCYIEHRVLTCTQREGEHTHTDACYAEHGSPACVLEESACHTHTEDCYAEQSSLTCTLEETEGHTHSEECYDADGNLICERTEGEGHIHSDECYITENVPVCGLEESEGHTHSEACSAAERTLICEAEGAEIHTHTDACYTTTLELVCSEEEHKHTIACYSDPEADVEIADVWERSFDNVELTGVWADDVLAIADTQLGYTESAGNYAVGEDDVIKGYTRYGAWYGDTYGDWSAMFVSFCLNYAGVDMELMPVEADCAQWVQKLSEAGTYHRTGNADDTDIEGYTAPEEYTPRSGDLIFFAFSTENDSEVKADSYSDGEADRVGIVDRKADHVGFVYELIDNEAGEAAQVKTIEGDSDDAVRYNTYDLSDVTILGYAKLPENPNPQPAESADQQPAESADPQNTENTDPQAEDQSDESDETMTSEEITLSVETENNITITMTAPADAFDVPAEELTLVATAVEDEAAKDLLEQEAAADDAEDVKRTTVLFDIQVMHGEEAVQPKTPVQVSFSGIDTPKDDAQVFHVDTDAEVVEEMSAEQEENGDIVMEAPHFSIFGITYTVDFHNGDITFSIEGGSSTTLSAVFAQLNINRNITDVVSAEFSDPSLLAIERAGDDWKLTSLKSFDTEETLTIIFADGEEYRIRVTDPQYSNGIPILTSPSNNVALINVGANTVVYYATLEAAMNAIGADTAEYMIVFTKSYTSTQADWDAVANKGGKAQKITFTSTYIDGSITVRRYLTLLSSTWAPHNLNTLTEFKNIAFIHGATSPRIYARGNTLILGEGITNSTQLNMQVYGGDPDARNVPSANVTISSGSYDLLFSGGWDKYTVNANVVVGGTAKVKTVCVGAEKTQTPATATATISVDGSKGAKVTNIIAGLNSSSNILAGAKINTTVSNMKDIEMIDLYSNSSASGTLTIKGNVQVQKRFWTSGYAGQSVGVLMDVNIADNATLTVGSNSGGTVQGVGNYSGYFWVGKDLIMGANSKVVLAGDARGDNPTSSHHEHYVEGNLIVNKQGAQIDIYKSGETSFPLTVVGNYVGTQKLTLGVYKEPKVSTMDACLSDKLLAFPTPANARKANYLPGAGLDGILREVSSNTGYIIPDKLIKNPINVGIGQILIGTNNPYYDASDPASGKKCTIQYIKYYNGSTDSDGNVNAKRPYARDKKLASSYTLTGTNYADYNRWAMDQAKVQIVGSADTYDKDHVTVELIFDNVRMSGGCTKSFDVSYSDTTITLKNGTTNNLTVKDDKDFSYQKKPIASMDDDWYAFAYDFAGCIAKNGMKGRLTIRCENSKAGHRCAEGGICGILNVDGSKGGHAPGIGSYLRYGEGKYLNDSGFSNLYITGGIIEVKASNHTSAIGSNCFTWSGPDIYKYVTLLNGRNVKVMNPKDSPAYRGETCKNINITRARVKAYGGEMCPGIGGGYGGMLDGLFIYDGAYVYAKGGDGSPGIGSGSADDNTHPLRGGYAFHVKNISISGGDTVVEAIGGTGLEKLGNYSMPGIGVGSDNIPPGYKAAGDMSNAFAKPDDGYMAVIKQGSSTNGALATFIDGAPSEGRLDIKVDQSYTLVFFFNIEKTARINGQLPYAAGSKDAPVSVRENDRVEYKIDLSNVVNNNGTVKGSVSDVLPPGMKLVCKPGTATPNTGALTPDPGSCTPGMTASNQNGVTTVRWDNQTFTSANQTFFFTVTVDPLPAQVIARDYVNSATVKFTSSGKEIEKKSNETYHHVDKVPGIELTKVDENNAPLSGAGFTVFECTNTTQGHVHTNGTCSWDAGNPLKAEVRSGSDGKISFTGFSLNKKYIMAETTTPAGYREPAEGSYILIEIGADGTYTLTGFGDFAKQGMLVRGTAGYTVKNILNTTLTVTKTVTGAPTGTSDMFDFIVEINEINGERVTPKDGTYKVYKADGSEDQQRLITVDAGLLKVKLGDGERLVITDMHKEWIASVEEKENARYTTGYLVDMDPAGQQTPIPGYEHYLHTNEDHTVTFFNEYKRQTLTVIKEVPTVLANPTDRFEFTVDIADGQNRLVPADGTYKVYVKNTAGNWVADPTRIITKAANGQLKTELGADEKLVITDIPTGYSASVHEKNYDRYDSTYIINTVPNAPQTPAEELLPPDRTVNRVMDRDYEIKVINRINVIDLLTFMKVDENGDPLSGAGFTIYDCTNADPGHVHTGGGCTWDANNPLKAEKFSGADGRVSFTGFSPGRQYIMAETTAPTGYRLPTEGSYILIDVNVSGTYTFTGFGDFADLGLLEHDALDGYRVINIPNKTLTVTKTVIGAPAGKSDMFRFNVRISETKTTAVGTQVIEPFIPENGMCKVYKADGSEDQQRQIIIETDGNINVELGTGEKLVVTEIPISSEATVEEVRNIKYTTGYLVDQDPAVQQTPTLGASATVQMDEDHTIDFYNTHKRQTLTVIKEVPNAPANLTDKFEFTVDIVDGQTRFVPADGTYKVYKKDNAGSWVEDPTRIISRATNGQLKTELGNNEKLVITEIPMDYTVAIYEKDYAQYNTFYYKDPSPGAQPPEELPMPNNRILRMLMKRDHDVFVVNRFAAFDLKVKKTVVGTGDDTFTFDLAFTNNAAAVIDSIRRNTTAQTTGYTIETDRITFDLKGGEEVTIPGIPIGTQMTLTETVHDGYSAAIYDITGGIHDLIADGDTATFTMDAAKDVEVMNNTGVVLPSTGGMGTALYTVGGMMIMLVGIAIGIISRRRGRERRLE